jgi:hypothetical protein
VPGDRCLARTEAVQCQTRVQGFDLGYAPAGEAGVPPDRDAGMPLGTRGFADSVYRPELTAGPVVFTDYRLVATDTP